MSREKNWCKDRTAYAIRKQWMSNRHRNEHVSS